MQIYLISQLKDNTKEDFVKHKIDTEYMKSMWISWIQNKYKLLVE
jgi:hypothetical protein